MPDRYHVPTAPAPGRFRRVGKYGCVDRREDCSRCTNCVKLRCQYRVYEKEAAHDRDPQMPVQPLYDCKACLSCVQGCTKGLLELSINPEYLAMGDAYWRPDIIAATWNQADTGRIPVSGAGYRGPFAGDGFDAMWTDMSEIVRPTRDGIHGREYISTSVDMGPKPMRLSFGPDGELAVESTLIEIPIPAILDLPPWPIAGRALGRARAAAATTLKTLFVARPAEAAEVPAEQMPHCVPLLEPGDAAAAEEILGRVRMLEIADGPGAAAAAERVTAARPEIVVGIRLDLSEGAGDRVSELIEAGLRVFHLCADLHGRQWRAEHPRHIKDVLRAIHGRLVDEGVRDEITLIASGGIALAEHMAKAIICGADLVGVGTPLLVALGCRVCRGTDREPPEDARRCEPCPAGIGETRVPYAAQRMVNLMGAWHAQLIEVLGAMGMREVRRLRGETGRAIFREDMEREAFGDLLRK